MPLNDRLFDILYKCSDEQLGLIWSTNLKMKPSAKGFEDASREQCIELISAEIRSVAGHTIANVRREPHEMSWGEILRMVAKQMAPKNEGIGLEEDLPDEEAERQVLRLVDARVKEAWNALSEEEQEEMIASVTDRIEFDEDVIVKAGGPFRVIREARKGIAGAISGGLLAGGGATALAVSAASGAANALVMEMIGIGAVAHLTSVLVTGGTSSLLLVPAQALLVKHGARQVFRQTLLRALPGVGWAVTAVTIPATIAHLVMSPSYRKLVPAVVAVLAYAHVELDKTNVVEADNEIISSQ